MLSCMTASGRTWQVGILALLEARHSYDRNEEHKGISSQDGEEVTSHGMSSSR